VPNIKGGGDCEVKVTGDVTVSWKGDGGADAVGTEYWMSEDEIREALEFLATGTKEEKERQVEEAMKEEPRLYILLLNCTSTDDRGQNITLSPSAQATYGDVPFKAGDYVIPVGGALGGAEDPGEFGVLFGVEGDDLWKVSEAGALKITRWDNKGIAGTFNFKAEEVFAEAAAGRSASRAASTSIARSATTATEWAPALAAGLGRGKNEARPSWKGGASELVERLWR
jgi:hypothetical protein